MLIIQACSLRSESIPITTLEYNIVETFYNNTIDASKVDLFEDSFVDNTEYAAVTIGNKIYFKSSLEYNNHRFSYIPLLVHELAHVWQWQHHKLSIGSGDEYTYNINTSLSFLEYGREQQATILEDYYLLSTYGVARLGYCQDCDQMHIADLYNRYEILYQQMIDIPHS